MADEATDYTPLKVSLQETSAGEKAAHRRFVILGVILCGVLLLGVVGLFVRYKEWDGHGDTPAAPASLLKVCTHPIYCTGALLEAVQLAQPPLFADSKTFVDMPCRSQPADILSAFEAERGSPGFNISNFVAQNFYPAGSEIVTVHPPDFVPHPERLLRINNSDLQSFAFNVHAVWTNLTREFNTSYSCGAACLSSMPVPYPFVVPGGRFREFYYWDTYWIVKGLLVSNLTITARNTLENLLWSIKEFGFVPNGARIYYVDRSQPPLLTMMVDEYIQETGDVSILGDAVGLLHQEHQYWMQTPHRVPPQGNIQPDDVLNRFYVTTDVPRPESFREDTATLHSSSGRTPQDMYSNLATGAETGWDYSTRWFANDTDSITAVNALNVVPMDLNAVLLRSESILRNWTCAGGLAPNPSLCAEYDSLITSRIKSMVKFFPPSSTMGDYLIDAGQTDHRWFGAVSTLLATPEYVSAISAQGFQQAIDALASATYSGGVPASLQASGQQWDFPNAWSPVQYFSIEALELASQFIPGSAALYHGKAMRIAQTWIDTTYCAYHTTGALFEKYNVSATGAAGHGGEYVVQTGFGWTNGLVLWILDRFSAELTTPTC